MEEMQKRKMVSVIMLDGYYFVNWNLKGKLLRKYGQKKMKVFKEVKVWFIQKNFLWLVMNM